MVEERTNRLVPLLISCDIGRGTQFYRLADRSTWDAEQRTLQNVEQRRMRNPGTEASKKKNDYQYHMTINNNEISE